MKITVTGKFTIDNVPDEFQEMVDWWRLDEDFYDSLLKKLIKTMDSYFKDGSYLEEVVDIQDEKRREMFSQDW